MPMKPPKTRLSGRYTYRSAARSSLRAIGNCWVVDSGQVAANGERALIVKRNRNRRNRDIDTPFSVVPGHFYVYTSIVATVL
jgi:hypothetical protein